MKECICDIPKGMRVREPSSHIAHCPRRRELLEQEHDRLVALGICRHPTR